MSIVHIRKKMGSTMKYIFGAFLLIFAVGIFVSFGPGGRDRAAQVAGTQAIARVNGQPISRRAFLVELDTLHGAGYGASLASAREAKMLALEELTRNVLLDQAMKNLKIRASRENVDAAIQDRVDARTTRQDRKALREYLDQNNLTYEQYVQQVKEEEASDRPRIEQRVMYDKLRQKVESQVTVTDQDVRQNYLQIKGRHILINPSQTEPPKGKTAADLTKEERDALAKVKADQIEQKLAAGASFAALAKADSNAPDAQKGGDFGEAPYMLLRLQYGPEVADAVAALKPGQHTPVLHNDVGYHIFECESVTSKIPKDFDQIKDQVRQAVLGQRQQEHFDDFMVNLRKTAKVEILDPELQAYQLLTDQPDQKAQAFALLQKALAGTKGDENGPGDAAINYELGELAESMGKPKDAEQYYLAAQKSAGGAPELHIALGELYRSQKRKDDALKQFAIADDGARDLSSANQDTHESLKRIYQEMGEKALAAAQQKWITDYNESRPAPAFPSSGTAIPVS
jgi:parvulin-like peptidyl-prolyl isomerase